MGVLGIYNELGNAQLERLAAAPADNLSGRVYYDTVTLKPYVADGTAYREILINRDALVIGTNVTPGNNVRLYVEAPGIITLLKGSETATPPVTPTNYGNFRAILDLCQVGNQLDFYQATPVNPAGSNKLLYLKSDGYFYTRSAAGTEWPVISQEVPVSLDWVQTTTPAAPAASRHRTYFKSDGYLYSQDSAGLERRIGSSGGTGINYITNPDFETAATGYNLYQDAAGDAPTDGTGLPFTPNVTIVRSTSSPLRGTASGLITLSAPASGSGVSYDFTIDSADKGRQVVVSFDYQTDSSFTSGYILMYVVDVTNGTVTQLAPYTLLKSATLPTNFTATFQAASNSTSYRLCWHNASASNTCSYKIDNVSVSPATVVFASPITDPTAYTPTLNSTTGVSDRASRWWRDGAYMMIEGAVVYSGGGAAGAFSVALPSGYSIDTSVPLGDGASSSHIQGFWGWYDNAGSAASRGGFVTRLSSTTVQFRRNDTSNAVDSSAFAAGDVITFQLRVPIAGWGSNVQVGGYDGRTVVARYSRGSTLSIPDATDTVVPFTTKIEDTHGAYSTSTGLFTAPVTGYYSVSAMIDYSTASASGSRQIFVYKNGALYTVIGYLPGSVSLTPTPVGNAIIPMGAGDTLGIYARQNSGGAINAGNNGTAYNHVDISLVPGRSALAVGDTVATRAARTSNLTGLAPNNTTVQVSMTSVASADLCYDRTGSYDTTNGYWTCPAAGLYHVTASMSVASTNVLANRYSANVLVGVAGAAFGSATLYLKGNDHVFTVSVGEIINVSGDVYLSAGDRVYLGLFGQGNNSVSTITVTGTGSGARASTFFSIHKVGI